MPHAARSAPPSTGAEAPHGPAPAPPAADDAEPWDRGWLVSSLELRRGVEVREEYPGVAPPGYVTCA